MKAYMFVVIVALFVRSKNLYVNYQTADEPWYAPLTEYSATD